MIINRVFLCLICVATITFGDSDFSFKIIDNKVGTFVNDVVNKGTTIALNIANDDKNGSRDFNEVWEESFDLLKKGGALEAEYENVPDSAFIARDKINVKNDINDVLNDVIDVLTDGRYVYFRNESKKLKKNIKEFKSNIIKYREKKISAPISSIVYTTKEDYDKKIKNANNDINTYKKNLVVLKESLKQYLVRSGVKLNSQQIDMLLSSVDGDDIIRMTLVLKVLNKITDQLMSILEDSNEELSSAKKYYAMHLLSFELVVHIYQKYIDRVDKVYFVKLRKIMDETTQMISKTHELVENEMNDNRRKIYLKNIEAQKLTQKATEIYINYLDKNKNKIVEAQKIALQNLKLAKNTYKTVTLSAQLQSIMTDNKHIFNKLLSIQMPDIVPFENTQLKIKFQELTNQLEEE